MIDGCFKVLRPGPGSSDYKSKLLKQIATKTPHVRSTDNTTNKDSTNSNFATRNMNT